MRKKYKGYLLCADYDLRDKRNVFVAVFDPKTFNSIHEDKYVDISVSAAITELKEYVGNLIALERARAA